MCSNKPAPVLGECLLSIESTDTVSCISAYSSINCTYKVFLNTGYCNFFTFIWKCHNVSIDHKYRVIKYYLNEALWRSSSSSLWLGIFCMFVCLCSLLQSLSYGDTTWFSKRVNAVILFCLHPLILWEKVKLIGGQSTKRWHTMKYWNNIYFELLWYICWFELVMVMLGFPLCIWYHW